MTLIEELEKAQNDLEHARAAIVRRLRQLEPQVREFEELREQAQQHGLTLDDILGPKAQRPSTKRSRPRRASTQGEAPQGARRRGGRAPSDGGRRGDILRLVSETPGVTITQIGKQLNVDPTGLYRPVRALVAEGKLVKQGAALHPGGQQNG